MSDAEQFAAQNGALINQNSGMYLPGRLHSYLKKLRVALSYQSLATHLCGHVAPDSEASNPFHPKNGRILPHSLSYISRSTPFMS